jgi:2-amino-4-hydroxy-6-hydroxymethyldihydropteridine diphosphokinase
LINQQEETRDKNFVLLSLGSNLGRREYNIRSAFQFLSESGIINEGHLSSMYETEPVGYTDQPWFINAVVSGYTILTAEQLLVVCKSLEYLMGRRFRQRWHEREIDIDILIYGSRIYSGRPLTVPHPRMHQRRFVMEPAAEVAPTAIHPELHRTMGELLKSCADNSVVRHYE